MAIATILIPEEAETTDLIASSNGRWIRGHVLVASAWLGRCVGIFGSRRARQMVQEASSNGTFGRMGIVGGGVVLTQKARITQA